ncbi:MFS general substrate transporter [Panus rudis PR-1116 ss-1]|nr:MFS general substrate transporter [Panus rudis PR-1116 ss-1]
MSPSPTFMTTNSLDVDRKRKDLERRIIWKLDLHVLPSLALLWLVNFIDRIEQTSEMQGLERDTKLRGDQFNICLTVFYVSYIIVELPSNLVMKKLKPSRWLPLLVALWGMVTTLSGLVQNFSGLIAIRFFLGLCEGGLLPGMMLYLSTIYKRHELQSRVGIFYASASLSGAFGGLIATAIIKMDGVGGLAGWRWIFVLEGIATVAAAGLTGLFLPADLESAKFFTDEERGFALNRFKADYSPASLEELSKSETVYAVIVDDAEVKEPVDVLSTDTETSQQEEEKFEWREVMRGARDPQMWFVAFSYMGIITSIYSFSLFLPTIITGLGYSGGSAQLHTVPPYVPAVVLTVVVSVLADKLKWRGPFILIMLPVSMVGYILAIVATNNTQRYIAVFFIAAGIYPCAPCALSILPNNVSPHYKRATAVALQIGISNCAGFVATFSYTSDQAPDYKRGHTITLAFVVMSWLFMAANVSYCLWENRARASGRRQSNLERYQELWNTGKTRAPIGDRHPDFRHTL